MQVKPNPDAPFGGYPGHPGGLNAHWTAGSLAEEFARLRDAAG
jgi:hypothetical protein